SGKSTLLDFLEQELERDWLVVRYDAWRQARVGPPWWTLLVHLRLALADPMSRREKLAMRTAEAWSRIRVAGAVYALTLVVLVAAALGLFFLLRPADLSPANAGDVVRSAAAVLTAVGTLVGGALVASRFLLWESARGARVYEEIQTSPMEGLAEHFAWLIGRANRPVIFFVDDLDRCDEARVVDLLDSIQTLVRDLPERVRRRRKQGALAPFFVVAAEGAWIRRSYEHAHKELAGAVAEPGRSLGYLFLDKVFQLTVHVPTLSPELQGDFLNALLRSRATTVVEGDLAGKRKLLHESTSEAEVIQTLREANPEVREALAGEALEKLTEPRVEQELEHDLQRFASLLERNPRSMKRFVNAYGVERAVRVLEGNLIETGPLALWTILRGRWPELAEYLESRPEAIECIGADAQPLQDMPAALHELLRAPAVVLVATCQDGGPLTPELLAACCGNDLAGAQTPNPRAATP
ncbi:MAG: P-loop NTPase fold protein, partial [Gaiellaceae bacterium]